MRPLSQRDASSISPITRTPACARRNNRRLIERNARAQHEQVGRRERLAAVRAQLELDAGVTQLPGGALVNLRAGVGERHARAALGEQQRGGNTAARRADDRHVLSAHRECHLSFKVVRLKSAKMMATIMNRVITFGSLQPISSK